MVQKFWTTLWILILAATTVLSMPLSVQKRQSDQRIAELQTLLALHKYGVGYGVGSHKLGGRNSPGYGIIDFNYIGRRKKSTGRGRSVEDERRRLGLASSSWPLEFSKPFHRILNTDLPSDSPTPRRTERRALNTFMNYEVPGCRCDPTNYGIGYQ